MRAFFPSWVVFVLLLTTVFFLLILDDITIAVG